MSDQSVSNDFLHMADSEMKEGPSGATSGYEAETEGSFVFQAKSAETFPPKKRGWFNKDKKERRKKKKNQEATITLPEGPAQISVTTPLWEELDRRLANCDLFQPTENQLNLNLLANPEPPFPLFQPEQPIAPIPMYPEFNLMNQQPVPAFNPEEIPRYPAPAPNALEQWMSNDWAFQNLINDPYFPPIEPGPEVYPQMNPDRVAELRHYGEELINEGTRIRAIGENLVWKYDEREGHF